MTLYAPGDRIHLTIAITDSDGTATDPATLTVSVRESNTPSATTYTYGSSSEVTKDGTGNYAADILLTQTGVHYYRWVSTDPEGAEEGAFLVRSYF